MFTIFAIINTVMNILIIKSCLHENLFPLRESRTAGSKDAF
jgi:hypothetical protein